jgi:CPA2 family monovalent cation:H+ antiporter-2
MGHLPDLIRDLALILMTGAVATLLFRKIKQPLVLGYIIAGFLVGPHFQLFPTIADNANIKTLAEIGVIFLLFSLGLEFSFKKLIRVGGAASITALVEIIVITFAGYYTGKLLGWSTMDSLFLGGMLASSSTTIIIRAFEELGVKTKPFARIVFGVLIVEDIVVILLMVLLSTIAVTQQVEGMEIILTISKLLFFLAIWFIAGIYLLPTFLKKAKSLMDEETTLILALGLCLGMVVLATQVGFSAELGAFIMGSIIAETIAAEKVEHITKPVKDLFGAVFFVSVGMLIDPKVLIDYGLPVLAVTLLTLFGKLISTTIGALLSGQPLKQSVQVGMSMAQIGEFAFIVATLGLSLGVISDFLFPVAVGASAITTFSTPYLIKFSEPLYQFLERKLPKKWIDRINRYSVNTQTIQAESDWKNVLVNYIKNILVNGIIIVGIVLLSVNFLVPIIKDSISNPMLGGILALAVTLAVASPFLYALMFKRPTSEAYQAIWLKRQYNRGPLMMLEIVRVVMGLVLVGFCVSRMYNDFIALAVSIPIVILFIFTFSGYINRFYQKIEARFYGNLNARETAQSQTLSALMSRKKTEIESELTPWDAALVSMVVPPMSTHIGKLLGDLAWRERFGINIAYIRRGEKLIHPPMKTDYLLPHDVVGIIATDEQMQAFKPFFEEEVPVPINEPDLDAIALDKIIVDEHTRLAGRDIRSSGIRELTEGLVIGIERGNERLLNPDSTTVFEWGDLVWIVGNQVKISAFKKTGLPLEENS